MRIAAAALLLATTALAEEGYYRFPTIHDDWVVFSCENDLWRVPVAGGPALRLTTHPGMEAFPKFSPDGKWLAFSAEYQGNRDVYVMPASGGQPTRLTYHPGRDEVVAWKPDSSAIVFRSERKTVHWEDYLYEIPVTGGAATPINIGIGALASFSPDGKSIAFNRWGTEFRTWKRYRGGTAPDIWVGDLSTNSFRKITDWEGTDDFPMWDAADPGRIYFLSDRDEKSNRSNIFSCKPDGSDIRQHTHHTDFDCRWADMQGGRIVYMLGADIWVYDVKADKASKLAIQFASDRTRNQPRFEDAGKTLDGYSLNRDGSRLVASSRGELWITPAKPGRTIQLTQSSGIRERSPVFSPDGKKIAAITDQSGEQEIAIFDATGPAPAKTLTSQGRGWIFDPIWSPDSKSIAYADLTLTLFVVDAESGKVTTVDQSKAGEIRDYAFSPDGKWLAYSLPRSALDGLGYGATELRLYSLEQAKSFPVSTGFTDDKNPAWDPSGKYLYFISNRSIDPIVDQREWNFALTKTSKPCVLVLAADGKSPFLPDELKDPKDKKKAKKSGEKAAGTAGAKDEDKDEDAGDDAESKIELPEVKIDTDGLSDRVVQCPIPPDNYTGLHATSDKLFFAQFPTQGMNDEPEDDEPRSKANLLSFDFETKKVEPFIENVRDFTFSLDDKKIAYRTEEEILFCTSESKPAESEGPKDKKPRESINPSKFRLLVNPAQEWAQIFAEAWRLQRDFYWDQKMASIDWNAMRDRYGALLPRIATRNELNDLIGQLLGELGTSHTYVRGGDVESARSVNTGLLGSELTPDQTAKTFRLSHIYRPESWETDTPNPLLAPHARVKEGDFLWAINGVDVGMTEDVYAKLGTLAGQEVQITVGSRPDRSDARQVQIRALANEHPLRYRDWCRRNREYVDKTSGGTIGYMHLPDMGGDGLTRFIQFYYPQLRKQGIIFDDRYNGGGNVSPMIIERLKRQIWAYDIPRRGEPTPYPEGTQQGFKAVLINHWSASDGDIFPETFKLNALGPVIGKRSWGGVIGIRGDKNFIDGGNSTQPEFAWYDPKRGWTVENHGVDPDIDIDNTPDQEAAGKDTQLDRAISELQDRIKKAPVQPFRLVPAPDKSSVRPK
ncbi:MAG: S41 family peptidase [Phycisphaerales bacterium]|nr:PD40 domain-containing protein [Planctomycetota bacterium]